MTADEITKEQAAKYIKHLRQNDGSPAQRTAMANIVQALYANIDEVDLSGVDLAEGEADELLDKPFAYEWMEAEN